MIRILLLAFGIIGLSSIRANTHETICCTTFNKIDIKNLIKGEKYLVTDNCDLNGRELLIPEGCIIQFAGGSFTNGTLRLSNNVTIDGNGTTCYPRSTRDKDNNISNTAFIYAEGVKNISIRNIVLKGSYEESMGNLPFKSRKVVDSEHLIYIGNCDGVTISGLTITNFYSNKSDCEWYEVYSSHKGFYPILIHNTKDINIIDCKHTKSAGEAWNIFFSKNITINKTVFESRYGVSFLTIMYSNNVNVMNSKFVRKSALEKDTGNLVNIFASNVLFENNVVEGGDYDWGNEHVNCQAAQDYSHISYRTKNVRILNNNFIGCKLTNNTALPIHGFLPKYITNEIMIKGNIFSRTLIGICFGVRGNVKKAVIESNTIESENYEVLTTSSRFQTIVAYNTCPEILYIKNNIINCSKSVYDYSFSGPVGAILINDGKKIIISNNSIKAPFGIRYMGNAKMTVISNTVMCKKPQIIDVSRGFLDYSNNTISYEENSENNYITISERRSRFSNNIYRTDIKDVIIGNVGMKLF